jgi:ADP-heptose:LPS heptosyltransferase
MKICILQLGTFGDMILTTPIISAIKKKYPIANIFFIAGGRNSNVIRNHPDVSKIIVWSKLPHKLIQNIVFLRTQNFQYYIDPKDHYSSESQLIARIVKANVKIGLNSKKNTFDISIPDESQNSELHYTQRVFRAFECLGIELPQNEIPKPDLYFSENSKNYVDLFLRENNLRVGEYVVFNISASHPRKTFTPEALKAIFTNLRPEIDIVLSFDYKDTEKALNLKGNFKFPFLFFSRNIQDVFSLIQSAKAVVTPDTSIVHIATAYSKPTLAFYSGLDDFFKKFHPNNPKCIVVRASSADPGIHSIPVNDFIHSINNFLKQFKEVL